MQIRVPMWNTGLQLFTGTIGRLRQMRFGLFYNSAITIEKQFCIHLGLTT
jgi:hypothetical protein